MTCIFLVLSLEHYTNNDRSESPCRYGYDHAEVKWVISKRGIQWGKNKNQDADFPNGFAQEPFNGLLLVIAVADFFGSDHYDHKVPSSRSPVNRQDLRTDNDMEYAAFATLRGYAAAVWRISFSTDTSWSTCGSVNTPSGPRGLMSVNGDS